jgi:hypothetical protein
VHFSKALNMIIQKNLFSTVPHTSFWWAVGLARIRGPFFIEKMTQVGFLTASVMSFIITQETINWTVETIVNIQPRMTTIPWTFQ